VCGPDGVQLDGFHCTIKVDLINYYLYIFIYTYYFLKDKTVSYKYVLILTS